MVATVKSRAIVGLTPIRQVIALDMQAVTDVHRRQVSHRLFGMLSARQVIPDLRGERCSKTPPRLDPGACRIVKGIVRAPQR